MHRRYSFAPRRRRARPSPGLSSHSGVRRRLRLSLLPAALLALATGSVHAQTDYWTGNTDRWDVAANWTTNPNLPGASNDVVNNTGGTITFDTITAFINSFLNQSSGGFTMSGGTLNVTGNFTNTGSGTLTFTGGTLNVGGNFTSSAPYVYIDGGSTVSGSGPSTSSFQANGLALGGTLSNFTIDPGSTQSGPITFTGGGNLQNDVVNSDVTITGNGTILDAVTINGNLNVTTLYGDSYAVYVPTSLAVAGTTTITGSSSLYFTGSAGDTSGMKEISLGSSSGPGTLLQAAGNTLTISSNTLVHGYYGNIGTAFSGSDTLINQGIIASDQQGNLHITATNFINTGTLKASSTSGQYGSGLILSSANTVLGGTLWADGSDPNLGASQISIYDASLTDNLVFKATNGGQIVTIGTVEGNGNTLTIAAGSLIQNNGTLQNATINAGPQAQGLVSGGGVLRNDVINTTLTVDGALRGSSTTLDNVTVQGAVNLVRGYNTTYYTAFYTLVPNTFQSTGPVTITGGSTLVFNNATSNNTTGINEIFLGNNSYDYVTYRGNLQQADGNTLTIAPNTLIHGPDGYIGQVYGNTGTDALINQGTISADRSGALYIFATNFTNAGTLSATNGGELVVESKTTSYATGDIYVGAGSAIGSFTPVIRASGTTTVDGQLTALDAAYNPSSIQLQGGTLKGTGTIGEPAYNTNVYNAGGTVHPGDLLGTLTINGNYSQSAGGITEIDLGTTALGNYSQLKVSNLAQLGGQLDVKVASGYTLTPGETFDFLTYGSRSGAYDTLVALDAGFSYEVSYNDAGGYAVLTVDTVGSGVAAVPESSTLVTAGLMLGVGGLLLRRRKAAARLTNTASPGPEG